MSESFNNGEVEGLCRRYGTEAEARRLLHKAGFPDQFIPAFTTPDAFWFDIKRQLSLGRMQDGRSKILHEVAKEFPAASQVASITPQVPPQQLPAPAQQNQASSTPPASTDKTSIKVALIGAAAAITAAAVAIIPNVLDSGGSKDKERPSPSATASSSALINEAGGISQPKVVIDPTSGSAKSTDIKVRVSGFLPHEQVKIEFFKGPGLTKFDGPYGSENTWQADKNGVVLQELPIPDDICCAGGALVVRVTSVKRHSKASDQTTFTLT